MGIVTTLGAEMSDVSAATLSTILLVDDTPENLVVLGELLRPYYRVRVASSGQRALEVVATKPRPDLILLDVMMPGMDGYATLRALREDASSADIPVIFVTAMDSVQDEEHGLSLGAVDYITKPVRPAIVLARVRTHLELKQARDWLQDRNKVLEAEVAHRMSENQLIQDISIHALARLAETRDPETGNHLLRTQGYVRALAIKLRDHPRFADLLTDRYIEMLYKSAPLHDIGKVGVPDHILLKAGKLDAEEWAIMKTHAKMGSDAIEHAEEDSEQTVGFLVLAKEIAHWHHERWDGGGYPDGLVGDAIPISARLMTLADVFDALISRRCYKAPIPYEETRRIIVAERGRQFDPDVIDAFLAIFDEFVAIAQHNGDADAR
jgi:putative two-component system response regulator